MKSPWQVWTFAFAVSVSVHALAIAALSVVIHGTSPQLRLPAGDAAAETGVTTGGGVIRVFLLPMVDAADREAPTEYEAPLDVLEEIGFLPQPLDQPQGQPPLIARNETSVEQTPITSTAATAPQLREVQTHLNEWLDSATRQLAQLRRDLNRAAEHFRQLLASSAPVAAKPQSRIDQPNGAPAESVDILDVSGGAAPGIVHGPTPSAANKPPVYPRQALRDRQSGTVLLHLLIDADGTVSQASIGRSSGVKLLDDAALRAARAWRFEPAVEGSQAINCEAELPIEFVLE